MADVAQTILLAIGAGAGGWGGSVINQWFKTRSSRYSTDRSTDVKLEEHRDGLTFQLLEAARVEVAELRVEVHRLRPMEHHLLHFDEALRHLEELLFADGDEALAIAKRNARAFLNRVKRMREATGVLNNEVQRMSSAVEMLHRTTLVPKREPGDGGGEG
jgi:hypothetical protein